MKKLVLALFLLISSISFYSCVNNPDDNGTVVGNNCPDPPKTVPIDRIRLKGSPRAIITWSSDTRRDTSGAFWNLGELKMVNSTDGVKAMFVHGTSGEEILLSEIQTDGMKLECGLFSYRFLQDEFTDQIVLISNKYSDANENLKVKFFRLMDAPPFIQEVMVDPPHTAEYRPLKCYLDLTCGKLNFYKDQYYQNLFRTLNYGNDIIHGQEF